RREAQAAGPVAGDLRIALEAPYHDRGELAPVGAHRAGEALVVEQLEQRAEALRIAVVRRGRQEELVLEVGHQGADGPRALRVGGVAPAAGRRDVVRLVDDQQVE